LAATPCSRDIAAEMIPYTPEELIAIGEKEFAWCEAEMKKAAKEMGFEDWKKALAKVKSEFVPPGQQDDVVAQFAREAIQFVKERGLVTIRPLRGNVAAHDDFARGPEVDALRGVWRTERDGRLRQGRDEA
jgi:hypothetical protein